MEATPFHWPRYEVVDGELLVTPAPGGLYAFAVDELHASLHAYVEMTGIGHALTSPSDVELKRGVLVQPDLYVIPKAEAPRLRRDNKSRVLLLAIEILSPGSERVDRGRKRELYQAHVPAYWLIDVYERRAEVWQARRTRPTVVADRLEWQPAGASGPFVLDLTEYLAKVYGEG